MSEILLQQIWRFGLVGVVGFIVNAGMVEALNPGVGPIWSQGLAFPVAATVTWWLNRLYTFGASHRAIHHEWLRYVLANALGWVVITGRMRGWSLAYLWLTNTLLLLWLLVRWREWFLILQ